MTEVCSYDKPFHSISEFVSMQWHQYTLVLSQIDKKQDISYSLTVFATTAFRLEETLPLYQQRVFLIVFICFPPV